MGKFKELFENEKFSIGDKVKVLTDLHYNDEDYFEGKRKFILKKGEYGKIKEITPKWIIIIDQYDREYYAKPNEIKLVNMKYTLDCGDKVQTKSEIYTCHSCGDTLCSKHIYHYTDGNNIAITKNSYGYCEKCYKRIYKNG